MLQFQLQLCCCRTKSFQVVAAAAVVAAAVNAVAASVVRQHTEHKQQQLVIVFGITNSWMHHNIFALNQIVAIATIVVGNVAVAAIQWQ